jgi:uncharacterized membrane protein YhaH (DUF805 family)
LFIEKQLKGIFDFQIEIPSIEKSKWSPATIQTGRKRKALRVEKTKRIHMKYYISVLKNYANFEGRARRSEYWYFVLFNMIFTYTFMFIGLAIELPFFQLIYSLGVLVPSIAVGVRRMHDVGKSGWFILIPIYNLILACTNGDQGENEYGADPKSEGISVPSDLL